jgi:hypothetical protein
MSDTIRLAIADYLRPFQIKANAFLSEANDEVDATPRHGHLSLVLGEPLYAVLTLCQDIKWEMMDIKPFHGHLIRIIDALPETKYKSSIRSYVRAHEELMWARDKIESQLLHNFRQ